MNSNSFQFGANDWR